MKTLKKWVKSITLFFTGIMLLQSCVAYQKTPVSLEQAVSEQKRTKITTDTEKNYRYKQIVFEDGQFYGLERLNGNMVKIPIDSDEIANVYIQSKSKSTWVTVAVIVIPILAIVIISVIAFDNSFTGPNLFE